jgi:UDP-N-acetylmuramate dehydrogenase
MLNIQENVILAPFTTFRIGGPAKFFVEVKSEEELCEALDFAKENKLEFFILGGGSNLLVSDKGFEGLVIKMKLNDFVVDGELATVEVGAGVPLSKVVRDTVANGLTGMEWAASIPGTFGRENPENKRN